MLANFKLLMQNDIKIDNKCHLARGRMRIVIAAGLTLMCLLPACAFALDDTPTTPYMAPEPHTPPPETKRPPAKPAPTDKSSGERLAKR